MPPKHDISLLFHPKKKPNNQPPKNPNDPNAPNNSPRRVPPPPRVKPKVEEDDENPDAPIPETGYQEYRLLSSALNGWKYDVMRFDSRKPIDVFRWQAPIKLNRKDIRKSDSVTQAAPVPVGPMLGPDGKPVIGVDGRIVMVDAEGRPIRPDNGGYGVGGLSSSTAGSSSGAGAGGSGAGMNGNKDKGKANAAKKRFQKKTRQVFTVPEEIRQLRKEERYPWVLEDSSPSKNEYWIAQMEDVTKAETHAFFMPAANDVFKFVPAHRWYKFHKRLKHHLPRETTEVENLYSKMNKKDPQAWLAQRTGRGVSAATAALFKAEAEGTDVGGALVYNAPQSLGPGGRKLKSVDSGSRDLFDDDEEGGGRRGRKQEDKEGDLDEQVYEEEFADDDDKMEPDVDEEEAKEIEERLKREYKAANKTIDAGIDADTDDEDMPAATKQERAMQKLIRSRENNDVYESDEDKNPYASSEEEEEEETPVVATAASAIQEQQQKIEARSQTPKATSTPVPGTAPRPMPTSSTAPGTGSRATSPANVGQGGLGHSFVAKRATSPKVPKPKGVNISRGNSPLAGGSASLPGSRATSPETNGLKTSVKRKAEDSPPSTPATNGPNAAVPKAKKRKAPTIDVSLEDLENLLIEWLKSTPSATTRECIAHFNPYIVDKRAEFLNMVQKHATLRSGVLVLKTSGSAASPPAVST